MKLSALKTQLSLLQILRFRVENGQSVPAHFHITEFGLTTKHFIDCGGDIHQQKSVNLQIWVDADTDHRLKPTTLLDIIETSKQVLGDEDLDVEIEYQTTTIGLYSLDFEGDSFVLLPKKTDCLAKIQCSVPQPKPLTNLAAVNNCCTPGGGCC